MTPTDPHPLGADRRACLEPLRGRLRLPAIAAPMFLVSGPDLVIGACRAGIVGSFPAPNARTLEMLDGWMARIAEETAGHAPWAVNLVAHRTYERLEAELELVRRHRPPLVITALGSPARVVDAVQDYGGYVFADVHSPTVARKAAQAGVDGLILVCAGAGGHTGRYSPFAFLPEVRRFWDGPLVLAGAIAGGTEIRAAEVLGADFAYVGTQLIATRESLVSDEYRSMLIRAHLEDVVATRAVTGVLGNFMVESLRRAGLDPDAAALDRKVDFSGELHSDAKAWKTIWSAGQGVGAVTAVTGIADLIDQLAADYRAAVLRDRGANRWTDGSIQGGIQSGREARDP